ncbi:uncharacterized protein [Nicotiana sylvestris]|uniref:uncharacterized protein n=1 Tax=Nicotiana sylvestris TaxID=4096 RepID=UPI00388CA1AA
MCPPVKQKLRKFLKINDEVSKQIKAKVRRVVEYLTWLDNIVPVPKKDGKVRIWMDEEDAEKTTFIPPWGVYCYNMMTFGLKNAGATYMRAMTTIFHDMIHKEIDVYVDDIIIKFKKVADHIADLRKFCDRLIRYNLKLNPAKCAFGVPTRKLLGFIISRRMIELDPSKVKAIQELPPPRSKRDVMSFLRCLNHISCFIAQSTVICEPTFKMPRKDADTSWTKDYQKAFDNIKEYLSTPPILVPLELGRSLVLYLSVLDGALRYVLRQRDETGRNVQDVYYLSKKFTPYEARMDPLKYIFQKPMTTRKLAKWKIQLREDIAEAYDGWRMFFDGAANFKRVGIGAVLVSIMGQHYLVSAKLRFPCTNNMAEYETCILGLNMAVDMNIQELLVIDDSDLFVYQVHANMIKVSPNELNATSLPWPFAAWGMDVISPIEPTASNGHRFILVAIVYFTKWVEAASYKAVTNKVVAYFVKNRIVCRFGVPKSIVTDNTANLNSDLMKAMYGKRINAVCHDQLYQNRMSKAFNKRVKERKFARGQLVLKKIFPHQDEAKGKFSPNWQGPYMVHRMLTRVALILADMDGEI